MFFFQGIRRLVEIDLRSKSKYIFTKKYTKVENKFFQ
jgi:hypothetical protein